MGCDIHAYKEKLVSGKWVTADTWTPSEYDDEPGKMEVRWEKRFTERNYNLFGLLSKGVRREHDFSFEPRGLPFNVSPEVKAESDADGLDGHSHSYLRLAELREMAEYLKTATVNITGMKDAESLSALRKTISDGAPDWDLLYPYCQATNQTGWVEFAQTVPAGFSIGESLDTLIATFDGVDGDDQRLVFWFDN